MGPTSNRSIRFFEKNPAEIGGIFVFAEQFTPISEKITSISLKY